MSFPQMETKLLAEFTNKQSVWDNFVSTNQGAHTETYIIDATRNIELSYPGYKTRKKYGGFMTYDYRVDYQGHAVSHPSIIIDLYNKTIQYPQTSARLKAFLCTLAREGNSLQLGNFSDLTNLQYAPPGEKTLSPINDLFCQLRKPYLCDGNLPWNFSFSDLAILIPWIALQEDINYPMSKGNLQGRMMPFYRYIEAVHCATSDNHVISDVIERSIAHNQPTLWPDLDYREISKLKTYSGTLVKTKIDKFLNVSGSRHCSIKQQCREVALCWRDVPDG